MVQIENLVSKKKAIFFLIKSQIQLTRKQIMKKKTNKLSLTILTIHKEIFLVIIVVLQF